MRPLKYKSWPGIVFLSLLVLCVHPKSVDARKDPKKIFDRGVKYGNNANTKKAQKYFKKVSKLSFGHYGSIYNLSLIYLIEGNYLKSIEYAEQAKQLNPFDIRTDEVLSMSYYMLEKNEKAKEVLNAIVAKDGAHLSAHKKLGIIYLSESDMANAKKEFALLKNLSPSDVDTNLLLGASLSFNNESGSAMKIITPFQDKLENATQESLFTTIKEKDDTQLRSLLLRLKERQYQKEVLEMGFITEYENTDIVKQKASELKKKELYAGTTNAATSEDKKNKKPRPLGLKGTLTQTAEFYDRTPKASSPINSLNMVNNLKLEGKTKDGVELTAEFEEFYNRWDNNKLDFYKINAIKRNNYEVDVGKFSAKHFPSLVSYPTVLNGMRIWKKINRSPFNETEAPAVEEGSGVPVNLGEMYREHHIDDRTFENVELTAVVGRTLEKKIINARKEKNEGSYESSGQFEQWTQSYRMHSKVNSVLEMGASLSLTQDISTDSAVSTSTTPIESIAAGIDGGIDLLDNDLNIDGEIAFGNYDEDTDDSLVKHARDLAWIFKSVYKLLDTVTFGYEQKAIGRNFKVEGASQTQDKITHTIDLSYKPQKPKTWWISKQTFQFKPEIQSHDGGGTTKKRFRTFQSVSEFKLPQDAKHTLDYKYYKEKDKCGCTNYRTLTLKNTFEWTIQKWKTTIKPYYTFERKDDMVASPTDEKKKEYVFNIENKSIKNLELDYSFEREVKKFNGATTKSYRQFINSIEAKYTLIPSRLDMKFKAAQDFKEPSDTNQTDITTLTYELNYTSKDGDDKFNIKYERKNNIYNPWSDTSAYRQNYFKVKYTKKF